MRLKRAISSFLGIALLMALGSPTAMADTTHAFVKYITVANGGGVEPEGVDDQGNLIVWLNDEHAVAKFDANGNPVNFSALGSNILDGVGGHDCLHTPADCDRVATNGFPQTSTNGPENVVAIDHSGGPADGYIYVLNNFLSNSGREEGEVDVFAPSGTYLGKLDETQVTPAAEGLDGYYLAGVSVASNGVIYVVAPGPGLTLQTVNRFVAIDGVPSHDQFSGQLRAACANSICIANSAAYDTGAAGLNYYYAGGEDSTHTGGNGISYYMRFPQAEFHRAGLFNTSVSENFSPDIGPFGNGGVGIGNGYLSTIAIDPADQHVYIGQNAAYGPDVFMQEWDEQNHQIGPSFGVGKVGVMDTIAFDRSGGPHDGDIYVRGPGSNEIAVFGPPVTIPDINNPTVDPVHTTAQLSANIGLAGGPNATDCHVDYGFNAPGSGGGYTSTAPCNPPTPYVADKDVTVSFAGLTPETDYHYRIVAANANGVNQTNDKVFHTLAVLGVQTEPATNLTRTSADLNASLNPDGMATTYHFEYGSTTQYNNRTPERTIGSGNVQEPVPPENITGLQAGRTYHFRLVARNGLGRTKSADGTFIVPANPNISGVHTTNVTADSADLDARINPLGYSTTYHFEYGPSLNYESKSEDVVLGSQVSAQPVSVHIAGLQPGFVYHYRVVASNQWGTTSTKDSTFNFFPPECPNSHVRQMTNANYLPDCRAYELVSPGDAGNVNLFPGDVTMGAGGGFTFPPAYKVPPPNAGGAASAPARFGFIGGIGAVPGEDPPNSFMDRYVATRTSRGWVTTYPGVPGDKALLAARPLCSLTMDKCVDYRIPGIFGGGGTASLAPFFWDLNGKSLGRLPTNFDLVPNADQALTEGKLSADFSHFVFTAPTTPFAPDGLDSAPGSVYDNDIGQKSVVTASYLSNGKQIPQEVAPGADPNRGTAIAAVSRTGTHILMGATTNPFCQEEFFNPCPRKLSYPAHLYMRVNHAITYEVSPVPVLYQGMTETGSKVFFTSDEHLTSGDTDDSVDLYQWSESTGLVTLLSQGNGNGDSDDCTAFWDSACDVRMVVTQRPELDDTIASESGDVYFYSPEQLDPANPGVRNERNLYVYRNGAVHYVTTLDPGTLVDRMQISPDGSNMALLTRAQLTGYSNVAPDEQGLPAKWEEMYLFNPGTGEVTCASCIPSGEPPTILTTITGNAPPGPAHNYDVKASQSGRFMSDDGRVAFSTADALVPGDTNQKIDVYEFVENRPQLISTGTGDRDTQGGVVFYPTLHPGFEGISHDGVDLYFSTFETLVPEDHNGSFVKFYDARTSGGFPFNPGLLPCTAADECHGDASAPLPHRGLGTVGDLGDGGNAGKPHRRHKKKRHHKRHHKQGRGHHKGGHGHA